MELAHTRGCAPSVRPLIWLLALGVFSPDSTAAQVRMQCTGIPVPRPSGLGQAE